MIIILHSVSTTWVIIVITISIVYVDLWLHLPRERKYPNHTNANEGIIKYGHFFLNILHT